MTVYHALISPRGCVEYSAEFALGKSIIALLEHGKRYTNEQLAEIAGHWPFLLRDTSNAVEKNIKKWRYERQELNHR